MNVPILILCSFFVKKKIFIYRNIFEKIILFANKTNQLKKNSIKNNSIKNMNQSKSLISRTLPDCCLTLENGVVVEKKVSKKYTESNIKIKKIAYSVYLNKGSIENDQTRSVVRVILTIRAPRLKSNTMSNSPKFQKTHNLRPRVNNKVCSKNDH